MEAVLFSPAQSASKSSFSSEISGWVLQNCSSRFSLPFLLLGLPTTRLFALQSFAFLCKKQRRGNGRFCSLTRREPKPVDRLPGSRESQICSLTSRSKRRITQVIHYQKSPNGETMSILDESEMSSESMIQDSRRSDAVMGLPGTCVCSPLSTHLAGHALV